MRIMTDISTALSAIKKASSRTYHLASITEMIWKRASVDTLSSTHQRDLQCGSRPAVSQHHYNNRMVTAERSIQTGSAQIRTQVRSRPVRNEPQPPTGSVFIPLPRHQSKRDKRSNSKLGNMEPLLHFPPQAHDFEGFTEAETVQYKNRTGEFSVRSPRCVTTPTWI